MEVFDTQTRKLVSNVTSKYPNFTVGGLESGLGFDIGLYATNRKGHSEVIHLQAFTLKSAEKHTGEEFTCYLIQESLEMFSLVNIHC